MLAGLRATNHESAAEELLIVQFLHCAFRFLNGLHLNERKTFRALIMPVTYDLSVLHLSHAVEQFEEIAVRGARIPQGPFKQFASTLRRRRKLRLVQPEI